MAQHTSFRIGGPADVLLEAASAGEVAIAAGLAARLGLPYVVIGLGSNLLVLDGGLRGLVIKIGPQMGDLTWDDAAPAVEAGAGAALRQLAAAAADRGLSGLEFAQGIPGTLGGAVAMNAGAYGGEMSQLVEWVDVLALPGPLAIGESGPRAWERRRLTPPDLAFGYRRSSLQSEAWVALAARLALRRDDPDAIRERMAANAKRRQDLQPLDQPSAGSYFRRPPGHFAGPLIEASGLKGYRVGGAAVSTKHANFIVNLGGASAADVLAVARHVREVVRERTGVDLEPEVRVIGEPGAGPS